MSDESPKTGQQADAGAAPERETESPREAEEFPLPPPSFDYLVLSLRTQAEVHLGLLRLGAEEEEGGPGPNLRLARHTIDLLAMLQEKSRGNLTLEEQRLLENSLTELRFRFVQAMEDSRKKQ